MPIYKAPLNKEVLQTRISYIEDSIRSLERFKGISFDEFHSNPDNFRITFYDLHRALGAAMDIGSHILSRIPGARAASYKDIPRLLGKHKIIPADFADNQLGKMAGYPDLESEDITEALQYAAWLAKEEVHEVHQG